MKEYEAPVVEAVKFDQEIMLAGLFGEIYISNVGIEDGGNI